MDASHIEECLSLFKQLPGAPFSYLRKLDSSDFSIDSVDTEHDTLQIGGYSIQQSTQQVPTIVGPRETPVFIVYETVVIPGSYLEPEDADIAEFDQKNAFYDAVRAIVLREVDNFVSNIQTSDALAAAYSEEA